MVGDMVLWHWPHRKSLHGFVGSKLASGVSAKIPPAPMLAVAIPTCAPLRHSTITATKVPLRRPHNHCSANLVSGIGSRSLKKLTTQIIPPRENGHAPQPT